MSRYSNLTSRILAYLVYLLCFFNYFQFHNRIHSYEYKVFQNNVQTREEKSKTDNVKNNLNTSKKKVVFIKLEK